MAGGNSSRRKPTKKAGTHGRSTSSLTTGTPAGSNERHTKPVAEVVSDGGGESETWTEPRLLAIREQKQLLRLLSLGASPAAACEGLAVSVQDALLTFETDVRFGARLEQVHQSLTENIRAALYREAMKGNVTAQTYWLKEDAAQRSDDQSRIRRPPGQLIADLERIFEVLKASGLDKACR